MMERVDKPTERWLRSVVWWKLGAAECEALDAAEEEFVAVEKAKAAEEAAKAKALEEAWKERAREEARAAAGELLILVHALPHNAVRFRRRHQ